MKKYKLIKNIALSTPIIVTPLIANSCNNDNNAPVNLSDWSNKEKQIMATTYISNAKQFITTKGETVTWVDWESVDPKKGDNLAIQNGLKAIFAKYKININIFDVVIGYNPAPKTTDQVKKVLNKGITCSLTARKGTGLKGTAKFYIKSNIK